MSEKEPSPRNIRRLQALEADLKALRDSTQALITERDELQRRLSEAEATLEAGRVEGESQQQEILKALEIFEELVEGGYLARPRKRTLALYVRAVADRIIALSSAIKAAEERIAAVEAENKTLQEQAAEGEAALRNALEQIADLQQQIETRLQESQARIATLEKALAETEEALRIAQADDDEKIGKLVEENRMLSGQLTGLTDDMKLMQDVAEEANARVEAAKADTEAQIRAELTPQIEALQNERATLQTRLDLATKQLQTEGKTVLLPADTVVDMLNDLVGRLQGGLTGLRLRDGELKLRVGFGMADESGGFVIPTTDSPPELQENLQEITFRFDRSAGEMRK